MIELNPTEICALRAQAHHLRAIVSISKNGLSNAVMKEIDSSLNAHELIKVKLYGIERAERDAALATICDQLDCAPIQHIGNTLVLWRPKPAAEAKTPPSRRKPQPKTKKQAAAAAEQRSRKN
ncbi:MAG: YhbY family RNA-binding protein [Georgfuchsia sp.]